jgi:hypothetical protein
LLIGLAAISSAYPPDLSVRPSAAGTSHERKNPYFPAKKLGPKRTIAKEEKERKGKTPKKAEK